MREIRYHPRVSSEVSEILKYYTDISPSLADDFWEEFLRALEQARMFPERHHFDASGRRRSNLTRFPYHFLFRTSSTQIKITVVRHHSRSSSYGSNRT